MAEDEVPPNQTMTTAMLKAFAHPLRRRITTSFNRRKYNRAADIAAELGEPANKISFHLRVLADAGLIVEAPEQARDRRDRVWTVAELGSLSVANTGEPAADRALADVVARGLVEDHYALVKRVIDRLPDYLDGNEGLETSATGTFTVQHFGLTPAEFDAMMVKVQAVMREAQDSHDQDAPDTRVYHLDIVAAPEDD